MIRFEKFGVAGIPFYKDKTSFDLGYKGVSVIMGDNREGKISTSNAAGKSLLFSQIPELLVETPPQNDKATTQGTRWITFTKEDKAGNLVRYKILKKTVKGKERYKILRNDKDLNVRLKTDARKRIQGIHGLTEDDFYSLVYIDSNRPNLLKSGSSAQRKSFITDLFRLQDVDVIRKLLMSELRRVQEAKAALAELKQTKANLLKQFGGQMPSEDSVTKKAERLLGMQKRAKGIEEELHLLRDLERALEWAEHSGQVVVKYKKIIAKYGGTYEKSKARLTALGKRIEFNIKAAEAHDTYEASLRKYRKAFRTAPKLPELFDSQEDAIQTAKGYFEVKARVEACQASMERLSKTARLYQRLQRQVDVEMVEESSLELKASKKLLASLVDNEVCPTCQQALPRSLQPNRIKKRIRQLTEQLAEDTKLLNQQQRNKEAKKAKAELEALKPEYAKLCKKLRKAQAAKAYADLIADLPRKPEKPTVKRPDIDVNELQEKYKKVLGRLLFLEQNEPHLTLIERVLSVGSKAQSKLARIKSMREELAEINNESSVLESKLADLRRGVDFTKELAKRYGELKTQVDEEEAFKLLVEAYGNKGIRRMMLKRIGVMLEKQLNKFSRLVFIENFSFTVNIGTQFDILVKRKYANGKEVVSDVRKLSGAESRLFTVLMLLALLALLPRSRRTNLLILDEPTANMHPAVAENFAKFIKVLNRVIEHIVVITPLPDEQYHNARKFKAVKENGISKLVKVS